MSKNTLSETLTLNILVASLCAVVIICPGVAQKVSHYQVSS